MNRFWLLVLALVAATLAACAAEPSSSSLGLRKSTHDTTEADDDDDTTAAGDTTAAESNTVPTPADPAAPPIDPFQGAAAFAAITPATESKDHHLGTSNAGKDCLGCHGKDLGAPEFVLAGTIQTSATNTAPATGVQVRIVDATGNEVASVGTDDAGNFWFKGTTAIPAGARVGIRTATGEQKMSAAVTAGACNQAGCHSKDRPIFLTN